MPLPRPARLLRQCPNLLQRSTSVRLLSISHPTCMSTRRRKGDLDTEEDESELHPDLGGQYFVPLPARQSKQHDITQSSSRSELDAISRRIGEDEDDEQISQGPFGLRADEGEEFDDDMDYEPKEARQSPATLIGSKRIGMLVIPDELVEGVTRAIDDVDPKYVRRQFLQLREQRTKEPAAKKKKNFDVEPEMAVAVGAAFLPGEYAAARNVLEEMERRLGRDWLEKASEEARKIQLEQEKADGVRAMDAEEEVDMHEEGMSEEFKEVFRQAGDIDMGDGSRPRVIEASGSLGPGLWAMMDARGSLLSSTVEDEEKQGPVDYQFYHGPIHTRKFAHKLATAIPQNAGSIEYPPKFDRNFVSTTPAAVMSTFFLSTLPKIPQRNHVKKLLSFKSPYVILIDHARPAGWAAISKARQYIIEQNTPSNPLHIVAPCPHEKECPLLNTADMCGFSQRLQSPRFLRKTKHSSRGDEDKKYVYLVVARGPRPTVVAEGEISALGRIGRVAKEDMEKQRAKEEGKGVLASVEGSGSEHVSYERIPTKEEAADSTSERLDSAENEAESSTSALDKAEMVDYIRNEAYSWPRLVGPPLKKGGHIIMDVCAASGELERVTFARSHSKQSYHDARKSYWGDLFPHSPKGRVTPRPRGIKRLLPAVQQANSPEENMAWMDELFGREPGAEAAEYESLKEQPGVKISFDGAKRQRESWKTRSEMRKQKFEENIKMGKFYKLTKPEDYDEFPYDPKVTHDEAGSVGRGKAGNRKGKGKEVDMTEGMDDLDSSEYWSAKPPVWLTGNAVPTGKVDRVDADETSGSSGPNKSSPSGSSNVGVKRSYGTWTRTRVGLNSSASFTQRRYMSARPVGRSSSGQRPKVTIGELTRMKAADQPITVLTAYDFPTALLSESTGIDICLVGDSLSQVALGHDNTTQITLDEMIHHCKAVGRGAKTPFIIADLPFGSFESSTEKGVESAIRLIKEGGVDGVKIEGGREILPLVKRLSDVGIVVVPHVGLQPQRATSTSGYLVQGRSADSASRLLDTVLDFEQAGAGMFLLEAIPHLLGTHITERVSVPTIGIGAGPRTSGQVLVITDVLGTYSDPATDDDTGDIQPNAAQPRFVRKFGNSGRDNRRAINEYIKGVRERSFPEIGKETYGMKKEEWDAFSGGGKAVEA